MLTRILGLQTRRHEDMKPLYKVETETRLNRVTLYNQLVQAALTLRIYEPKAIPLGGNERTQLQAAIETEVNNLRKVLWPKGNE